MPCNQMPYCSWLYSQHVGYKVKGRWSRIKIVQSTFKHWKTDVQDREHGPVVTTWCTGVTL